jgi:septal ring factor EnvC (AmiA/AmiB activator)
MLTLIFSWSERFGMESTEKPCSKGRSQAEKVGRLKYNQQLLKKVISEISARLNQFKVTRHQISRRILSMNKRLERELGERLAEKRGWHWALTSFAFDIWGETEK